MLMFSDDAGPGDGVSRLNKWHLGPGNASRPAQPLLLPQHALYIIGRFLRLLSIYAAFRFLVESEVSVVLFVYFSLIGAALCFFLLQRPWRGKRVSSSQWMICVLNGAVYALAILLFGFALKTCGPTRCILAEYGGALVSAFSTLLFGRRGHRAAKIYGIIIMLLAFVLLARGWALGPTIHFISSDPSSPNKLRAPTEKDKVGLPAMLLAISAGVLSALRRLLARLGKSQQKKRLHAVTAVSSALFLLPVAVLQITSGGQAFPSNFDGSEAWVYVVFILFGLVFSFYIDCLAEDKLRMAPSSLKHLTITALSVVLLELLLFRMPFSLLGFLLLTSLLAAGIYWSTSVERPKQANQQSAASREQQRMMTSSLLKSFSK